jgi:mannosyltransferase OCH1-like enzyme
MYEYCHDKWIELNPDYSMVWYTNKDCDRFMLKMGDRINKAYLKLKPGAFKADLWRACILYKYGGIYVDSYATPEVGLEEMLKNYWDAGKEQLISIKDNVLYDCFGKKKYAIHNGFIVASKNHRKLGEYIYRIVSNVETNYYGTHPLDITGPICMYNVIKNECRFLRFYKWNWYQHVRNDKRELVMKKKYSLISYLYEKLVRMSASYPYMWETRDVYN